MAPGSSRLRHVHGAGDESKGKSAAVLFAVALTAAVATFFVLSPVLATYSSSNSNSSGKISTEVSGGSPHLLTTIRQAKAACCRGIRHQELWGSVVVWGSSHKVNSSSACCHACKEKCPQDGPCNCNSWIYCGDRVKCGSRYGECWLKNQDDPLSPDVQDSNKDVYWTSGLVYGKDMGIVELQTKHGSIRIQLLPDCAPLSVAYIIEILKVRHCAGCCFYRAEGRGDVWNERGNPISKIVRGPPQGLLQGTLEVEGLGFKQLPRESCPSIKRGMVGWIDGGPDFFISLAKHDEWYPKHTVFAKVVPEDMEIVEKLANLPTSNSVWSGVEVGVLDQPISLKLQRATSPVK